MTTQVIEKSGTGIEKSGTGIEKSGTGIAPRHFTTLARTILPFWAAGLLLAATIGPVQAAPTVVVSEVNDTVMVSVHGPDGLLFGAMPSAEFTRQYIRVPLWAAIAVRREGFGGGLMVQGSGSGEDSDSCGGSTKSSTRAGLMVQGSGSGEDSDSCGGSTKSSTRAGLMVQGSGSGESGSGNAIGGDAALPWGAAEIVADSDGLFIVVHRFSADGSAEYLVDRQPAGLIQGPDSVAFFAHPSSNRH